MPIKKTHAWSRLLRGAALAALGCSLASAHAEPGEDHPAVGRFPGAEMKGYDSREFEEAQLILSRPVVRNNAYTADKVLPLEGKVTYIHYEMPKTVSAFQVFRNYQSALKRSGFTELFVCERPCIKDNLSSVKDLMKARDLYLNGSRENQYLAAQRGNTYVSLWVDDMGEPNAFLFVIEKGSLDDGLIPVTGTGPIAKALGEAGRIDLYGFQFESGKATLTSASQPTLKELGKVLQDNPALQLDIIGHTDDVGGAEFNQRLSEARASAVATALATQQGIDMARLNASGRGMTQALAPNTSEAGRAKNRRVEVAVRGDRQVVRAVSTGKPPRSPEPARQEPTRPATGDTGNTPILNDANAIIDAANKLKGLFGR